MIVFLICALLVKANELLTAILHHEVVFFWWQLLVLIARLYLFMWGATS